jgi:UDP-N-acetylglucosamine 2-epimerase (non-hydrolysing)
MLDQVLDLFHITPDFDLNIMKTKQSLTGITNRVLEGLEEIFEQEKPDLILVHGDTTTTFAGALAAFYQKINVGHVEAGLRTFDKYFPFPEEMNRKLTGAIADIHFAPTAGSKSNLLREGIDEKKIFVTGNTVIDAMKYTVDSSYVFNNPEFNNIDYNGRKVIMVTAHRRENWGEGIQNICEALREIVTKNEDAEIVYLVHLNPVVKDVVYKNLDGLDRVHLLPPLDTKETHNLMNKCYMVMTDSGGLQEEAPHLGKPVLVLRDVTERPEAVQAGTVKLLGTDKEIIINEANKLLRDTNEYNNMSHAVNPYGDGKASKRIADAILYYFKLSDKNIDEFQV